VQTWNSKRKRTWVAKRLSMVLEHNYHWKRSLHLIGVPSEGTGTPGVNDREKPLCRGGGRRGNVTEKIHVDLFPLSGGFPNTETKGGTSKAGGLLS